MSSRLLLLPFCLLAASLSAQDPATPSPREILRARLAEEAQSSQAKAAAKPKATAPAAATKPTANAPAPAAAPAASNPIVATGPGEGADAPSTAKAAHKEDPTVLPKVEVKKGRITVLDQQLALQEQAIAREKKNMKASEVDKALNDSRIAKPLAIFGGESAEFRQRVSSERVSLMEDEKDIIEAIAHAKTKEEKAELQKQLDFIRAERRELERALR